MTYHIAKAARDLLDAELTAASAKLQTYPRNAWGLVEDSVRATPEYQADKRRADAAFAALREFNAKFVKQYKRERLAEQRARRAH